MNTKILNFEHSEHWMSKYRTFRTSHFGPKLNFKHVEHHKKPNSSLTSNCSFQDYYSCVLTDFFLLATAVIGQIEALMLWFLPMYLYKYLLVAVETCSSHLQNAKRATYIIWFALWTKKYLSISGIWLIADRWPALWFVNSRDTGQ